MRVRMASVSQDQEHALPELSDDEWMQDREVFAWELREKEGKVARVLYITEAAKRRWDPKNPTKFTPDIALEIVQYLMVAATKKDAAEAAGIGRNTLQNWLNRAVDKEQSTEELRAFASWVGRSRAMRRIEALRRIQRAGAEDWKAEAFVLERSDPDNWRQKNSSILENPDGSPVAPPSIELVFAKTPTAPEEPTSDDGARPAQG